MIWWQFLIIVTLLLWIIYKLPNPSRVDAVAKKMSEQLDAIEQKVDPAGAYVRDRGRL